MILLQNVWKSLNHLRGQPVRPVSGRRLGPPVAGSRGGGTERGNRQRPEAGTPGGGEEEEEEEEKEEARKKKQNLHTG